MEINSITFRGEYHAPYVNDVGIYVPVVYSDQIYDQCIITKELFVEAYNKWIKPQNRNFIYIGKDTADDWCEN